MQNKPLPVVRDLQGNIITPHDLPPPDTVRWTPNRKAIVVRAVRGKLMPLQAILDRYSMTEGEFRLWEKGLKNGGATGLHVSFFQNQRRARSPHQQDT